MITITLNQIKSHNPCADGWAKVLKAQGGTKADYDKPFAVSSILDSNDLYDALWVLDNCLPHHESLRRLYAVWCARQVQHLMTDERSLTVLDVAERYAKGEATKEELDAAIADAMAAARAANAAWAAWTAASVAEGAARTAEGAEGAAWAAASAVNAVNAVGAAQAAKLRQILDAGEWVD